MEQRKENTKTAMMAALIFLAISVVKIPTLHGYTHLGDGMILLGVLVLGGKRGALAGGIGAALADFCGGYLQWVLPSFCIKALMAAIMAKGMGGLEGKVPCPWLWGAVLGGLFQIVGYTAMKVVYYGFWAAMVMTPTLLMQTVFGWIVTGVLVGVLQTSGLLKRMQRGSGQ